MNHQSPFNSSRSRDHTDTLLGNRTPRSRPSSVALQGAASAFATPPSLIQSTPTGRGKNGARVTPSSMAAAAADSSTYDKHASSDTEAHTRLSVRDHIQNLEKSRGKPNLRPASIAADLRRPSPDRSPSYIAAQLASQRSPGQESARSSPRYLDRGRARSPDFTQNDVHNATPPKDRWTGHSTLPTILTPKPVKPSSMSQTLRLHPDREIRTAEVESQSQRHPGAALEAALGAFARSPSRAPSVSVQSDRSRSSSIVSRPRASIDAGPSQSRRRPSPVPRHRENPSAPIRPRISPSTSTSDDLERDVPKPIFFRDTSVMAHARANDPPPLVDQRTGLTESALADAMVASSLASSRVPSPKKNILVPPPPPRHPSKSRDLIHRIVNPGDARATSPKKGMKQTLRKPPKSDDEEGNGKDSVRRGRRHLVRKHRRKHHEGDRKKWRDEVTERQRKRYEGVWASNRGLFMSEVQFHDGSDGSEDRPKSDLVLNIVVRDIWKRSRLPDDVLEEVWDLVARPGVPALGRDEFVVGMWLIDQRLRGRKLPIRVSSSVWASVRHSIGLQVKNKIK